MVALSTSYAGSVTYGRIFNTVISCAQSGGCGKPDTLIALSDMTVDEEVVMIQRQKIGALKAFFHEARKNDSDACRVAKEFPVVLERLKVMNDAQAHRLSTLSNEFVITQGVEK